MDPVIINQSFEMSEVRRLLSKFYKVRVGDKTERNSIIFPKTSRAFLIKPLCELSIVWPPRGENFLCQDAVKELEKFARIHRHPFVFLLANELNTNEFLVLNKIQLEFNLDSNVPLFPITNIPECITMINDIIKPVMDSKTVLGEMEALKAGRMSEEMIAEILITNIGISSHDALVLLDGCKTIANIAKASKEQLLDCSLSLKTAEKIQEFFRSN